MKFGRTEYYNYQFTRPAPARVGGYYFCRPSSANDWESLRSAMISVNSTNAEINLAKKRFDKKGSLH